MSDKGLFSMTHAWRSTGDKRTIVFNYQPSLEIVEYLITMQNTLRQALQVGYQLALRNNTKQIPSAIDIRKILKAWYKEHIPYNSHHINPICKSASSLLKSYRKNHHGQIGLPIVQKISARIDAELLKIIDNQLRISLQPRVFTFIPIVTNHRHYNYYIEHGSLSEVLVTDKIVCLTFVVRKESKPLAHMFVAQDINFKTIDSTKTEVDPLNHDVTITAVTTQSVKNIVRIQNDFSRRRQQLQKHIKNPQKRTKKLRQTRTRQRNRVTNALHKLTTETVRNNPDSSFIFENLTGIRKTATKGKKSKKFRSYLNRWAYRQYQTMIEYKSKYKTVYINPRGTSTFCPVCDEWRVNRKERLKHPAWKISYCQTCVNNYVRDRLASLAISVRGHRLCGYPFTVSGNASWQQMKYEYQYVQQQPKLLRADGIDVANASNLSV